MVKITIPKSFGHPTAVFIVNHKRHDLQTGVEIEVDDAIAEVVNNAIALKPKKDPDAGKLSHDDLANQPHLYAHYFLISPSSTSGSSGTAHIFLNGSFESTEKTVQSLRDLIPSTVTAPKYYPATGWYVANSTQYAIVGIQSMSSDPTNAILYLKYINPSAGSTMVGSISISDATVGSHECHQIL